MKIIVYVLLMSLTLISGCYNVVGFDQYAYEKEFGKLKYDLKDAGWNYVGLGYLVKVNNQIRSYNIDVDASSKDLQQVNLKINLNIRIKKDKVRDYIENYRSEEVYEDYLVNKVQERAKITVLKYDAEDFIFKREVIKNELLKEVNSINELNYFTINDVTIANVVFSDSFTAVLEQKAQVTIERDIIIKQEENLKLISNNLRNIDADSYFKYIVAQKWDGKTPLTLIQ